MALALAKRRFTVDEYYRMAEAGILRPDERVELIEGEIIEKAAIGSRHAACVNRLTRLLVEGAGNRALVSVQNPVRLSDLSEPEPDLAVLGYRSDAYAAGHPNPRDTLLVIEVADTTAGWDRETKAPLYAVAGIREYWLVDIGAETIEVYRQPSPEGYTDVSVHRPGAVLRPLALPDIEIAVDSVLR